MSMSRESSTTARPEGTTGAGKVELLRRLQTSIEQLLELSAPAAISDALAAPTGFDSLSRLMDHLLREHPEIVLVDRELEADLRLMKARRNLIERSGGTYDTAQVAELLGITPEAVRKRIERGTLLSYKTGSGEHRLPRAQFDGGNTIEGVETVIEAMHVTDSWMRIQLFLDDDVIGALEDGRIEDARRAVRSYLAPVPEER